MAGFMKNAMTYLGMADVVDDDDEVVPEDTVADESPSFDSDRSVTPAAAPTPTPAAAPSRSRTTPFKGQLNRITTIHPKSYEEAQLVGRAIRDGVPVVLNLTGVEESTAYRIVDFSAGVVFGVRGSIERVTPRVFLLSPAQVNIKVEESPSSSNSDIFGA
ncbi:MULTISPECIES: cell division protein SepF [Bifidobacterium]|uniref:Cell division protein SepF n=1 Tax=Bifidobacterium tissieri TaxID=1630162 RepID=A0A5M9ZZ26_9BIFI|nr:MULTISPECIES: cell division protein SepF [Bifidobacterium]KAA8832132.1 cell division protein SepF [Bifidobacterium tissieri]KAA8832253.1 cell division protein SepF [Bifidobacterium tissieri]TPF96322.1 cell division protein SepF [Bifidobacterium sp. UTCIF-39]